MPRVKALRAEIGTTGEIVTLPITGNAPVDVATAVEHEHGCSDSHCDIAAALRADCPISAAYLLAGATETPLLDAVVAFYSLDLQHAEDWNHWSEFHELHGRECDGCGSFTYMDEGDEDACGNCLATFSPLPDNETDAFIVETRDGFSVSCEQSHLGTFEDINAAYAFFASWQDDHSYFPNAWSVNERGNSELLVRDPANPSTFKHEGTGYV